MGRVHGASHSVGVIEEAAAVGNGALRSLQRRYLRIKRRIRLLLLGVGVGGYDDVCSLFLSFFVIRVKYDLLFRPGDNLRLNRPRLKGRPTPVSATPGSQLKPRLGIRV